MLGNCICMWRGIEDKVGREVQGNVENLIPGKCWLVRNLFSEDECQVLIQESEKVLGYELVAGFTQYRHCYRVKFEDPQLLDWIWKRCEGFIPEYHTYWGSGRYYSSDEEEYEPFTGTWIPYSLQNYPRMCKYTSSDHHFAQHFDYSVMEGKKKRSFLTFMLYLNSQGKEFTGGNTNFLTLDGKTITHSVEPEAGLGIFFLQDETHELLHEGAKLTSGIKYIFRTEVMFKYIPEQLSPRSLELQSL